MRFSVPSGNVVLQEELILAAESIVTEPGGFLMKVEI